ncbi:uncharacterized protein LOC125504626 [Dendroctonus ponderosae]|uniref:uncharacterized protein LOC109545403 n=1 Tax=Dendroctonus ponderosae TaxID=77166 RepID=UPI0020350364|nr:uncharacterized protein LOC109545403 [Dendroctonus ponderosae]XP_048522848.1 uncharacterized protein LOC125504626 [Dendroctonus ponderosae]
MDSASSWRNREVCVVCNRIPDRFPVFCCIQKHICCQVCFQRLKPGPRGNGANLSCPLCRSAGDLEDSRAMPDCRSKANLRPGIGRPYRYNVNTLPVTKYNYSKNYQDFFTPSTSQITSHDEDKLFEALIGMSKEKFYGSQVGCRSNPTLARKNRPNPPKSVLSLPPSASKRPFRCPHKPCHKTVAVAQFVNHFKSEHNDVSNWTVERGKELLLPCDISLIEYNFHFCLSMITVYEVNRIDYLKVGGSESIVRTCNKFCQKIPISTFWLMASGSDESKPMSSCCFFWLFTNSEESHRCTLELSSKDDSVSLSAFCGVSKVLDKDFANVKHRLQGLVVTRSSLRAMLKEGAVLNLRVTVH